MMNTTFCLNIHYASGFRVPCVGQDLGAKVSRSGPGCQGLKVRTCVPRSQGQDLGAKVSRSGPGCQGLKVRTWVPRSHGLLTDLVSRTNLCCLTSICCIFLFT